MLVEVLVGTYSWESAVCLGEFINKADFFLGPIKIRFDLRLRLSQGMIVLVGAGSWTILFRYLPTLQRVRLGELDVFCPGSQLFRMWLDLLSGS